MVVAIQDDQKILQQNIDGANALTESDPNDELDVQVAATHKFILKYHENLTACARYAGPPSGEKKAGPKSSKAS